MTTTTPWPKLGDGVEPIHVPLREVYSFEDMWYLDTPQAEPIFERQADIIINNQSKGIVDVGCRHGPVLKHLLESGYENFNYMGFDTSPEPIDLANLEHKDYPNIEFRVASWDDTKLLDVDFDVDMVIWSGVLLYRPDDHFKLFDFLTRQFYASERAIIQEPMWEQRLWDERLTLNRITDQFDQYKDVYSEWRETIVDCEIFSGRRLIVDVKL